MRKHGTMIGLILVLLGLLAGGCVPIALDEQPEKWGYIIDDGRTPALWEVSVAAGAIDGSVEVHYDETAKNHSLKLNYHHAEAAGFNYIDYTRQVDLDLEGKKLELLVQIPQDPDAYLSFIIYDLNDRHAILDLAGTNAWQTVEIWNADFQEVAAGFDWSHVKLIRFRSIGDAGENATQGAYLVDSIVMKWTGQE